MSSAVLQLLVICAVVILPVTHCTKKLEKWNTIQNRNANGDFNFGQDVRVIEGSGGTFNGGGKGNKVTDDDDEDDTDFDTFDFSGSEEIGSAVESVEQSPPVVKPDKPCLSKLREATGWTSTGFGAGSTNFVPSCTYTGDYAPIQCHRDECWCADRDGNQIIGTVRRTPLTPDCSYIDRDTAVVRTSTVNSAPPLRVSTQNPPHYNHEQHPTRTHPPYYPNEKHIIGDGNHDNQHYGSHEDPTSQKLPKSFINPFYQPGILAAIIAGAVIGLLSAVLLVMFVIYHLRHSRDHSEEKINKVPIIGYTNSHDRDLYA